jgi:hypothetical protein
MEAETGPGPRLRLLRGPAHPAGRRLQVFRHAAAVIVALAETVLRRRISRFAVAPPSCPSARSAR